MVFHQRKLILLYQLMVNRHCLIFWVILWALLCSRSRKQSLNFTPEANVLPDSEGERSMLMTSPAWPWKLCIIVPLSTSHNAHVLSPLPVNICHSKQKINYIFMIIDKKTHLHTTDFIFFKNVFNNTYFDCICKMIYSKRFIANIMARI